MVQENILIKAALTVYLRKLKNSEESPFTIGTINQIEIMLKRMDAPRGEQNKFLEEYSISDLKILIKECYDMMQNCRAFNEKTHKYDGNLNKDGLIYSQKLDIIQKVYDAKIEGNLKSIKCV